MSLIFTEQLTMKMRKCVSIDQKKEKKKKTVPTTEQDLRRQTSVWKCTMRIVVLWCKSALNLFENR